MRRSGQGEATGMRPARMALLLVVGAVGLVLAPAGVSAGKPEVRWVELSQEARHWRVTVTLEHSDEGDYHFLERWQVRTPGREVLGVRRFHTPRPQALERIDTLRDIRIPRDVDVIHVRAGDKLHGWGPRVEIDLREPRGDRYRIRADTDG